MILNMFNKVELEHIELSFVLAPAGQFFAISFGDYTTQLDGDYNKPL